MHTHRRAWMLRVGVTAALVAGATAGLAAPAYADDPEVRIITLSNNTLTSGQQANLQYSVKNTNREATEFTIRVETSDGLQCDGECTFPDRPLEPDETATFNARLISPNLRPGEERDARVQVIAQSRANSQDRESAEQDITLRGPQQAPTVERVAGRITDADTGDGVPNANVAMIDSAGKTWQEEADDNGRFSFTSSAAKPIAPGRVTIAVQADGFSDQRTSFSVGAGPGRTNVRLRLAATAAPSASASAPPTTPPTLPPTVAPETTAGALGSTPVNDEDSSLPWVFILGGLLVALGVGAIVLLLVRRKQDKELADEDAEVGAAGAAAVPASRGAFHGAPGDPTRVANRAGMGADATMVGRPNLADAPTMLQSPIRDEYADPYGLPAVPPQAPGYGGAPTQPAWAGAGGYGDATQVGRGPVSGPGYGAPTSGAPAGGYGPPTSGAPGGAYGPPTSGAPGGYGAPAPGAAGYGAPAATGPGGYGAPPTSGPPGGYGAPTSGTPGGYPPPAPGGAYSGPPTQIGGGGYGGPPAAPPGGGYGGSPDTRPGYGGGYDARAEQAGGYDAPAERGGGYAAPAGPTGGYGAPAGPAGGYAAPAGPAGGYDGFASPAGGYDGSATRGGGYDGPGQRGGERYDEPTGLFGGSTGYPPAPAAPDAGPDTGRGYGAPAGAPGGGYGGPPSGAPGGGYEQGGYEPRGGGYGGNAGYDSAPPAGYDGPPGRGAPYGYDAPQQPAGGYGTPGSGDPRGYDNPRGGQYDERDDPPSRHSGGRSDRRPLDWLDD